MRFSARRSSSARVKRGSRSISGSSMHVEARALERAHAAREPAELGRVRRRDDADRVALHDRRRAQQRRTRRVGSRGWRRSRKRRARRERGGGRSDALDFFGRVDVGAEVRATCCAASSDAVTESTRPSPSCSRSRSSRMFSSAATVAARRVAGLFARGAQVGAQSIAIGANAGFVRRRGDRRRHARRVRRRRA